MKGKGSTPFLFYFFTHFSVTLKTPATEEALLPSATFESFGLKATLLSAIKDAGFLTPSPIQAKAIPLILEGKDIIGQAHTGTGKTAAFGLPSLNNIEQKGGVQLLVITPTRELATQVSDELFSYGKYEGIKTVTVYGGASYNLQFDSIARGAQVVVATPGRLLDILKGGRLKQFKPSIVVLDEADEMLDMGFLDDIREIFSFLPEERQTLLFSATMPAPIKQLANKILKEPVLVSVTTAQDGAINKDIEELYCVIEEMERDEALMRLIDSEEPEKSIIFCRTKREVDRLATALMARGYLAKSLHGDIEQNQRNEVIKSFQSGKIQTLVATDVAARGLDIRGVSHVFNFHIPFEPESYVHRIGRTGRAGKKGIAITLVTPREFRDLRRIKQTVGRNIVHKQIPSLGELQKQSDVKLLETIKAQEVHPSAEAFFAALAAEIGAEAAALKISSALLAQEEVVGPEHIGLHGERLNRFLSDINGDRRDQYYPPRRPPFRRNYRR